MTVPEGTKVLLIGGGGFIGRHLAAACLRYKLEPIVADINGAGIDLPVGTEFLAGDYRDPTFLQKAMRDVDMVVHLAHHQVMLTDGCDITAEYVSNIAPTTGLMDTCINARVKKLLFVSSGGTVYGNATAIGPLKEDSVANPISLYGASKLITERIGFLYHAQRGLPFIAARPGNAYGPGQIPFRGQGIVATAMASALRGRKLTVYGDGSAVRDYIYVEDLAEGLVSILRFGRPGQSYNIGTGTGISLRQLLMEYISPITNTAGFPLEIEYSPNRGVDVAYNVLDSSKLLDETGFKARTFLLSGLNNVWSWLLKEYR